MKHMPRTLLLVTILALSLSALPLLGLPYQPLRITAQTMDGYGNQATGAMQVEIKDFKFTPEVLNIKVGTTVTWRNSDSAGHTATSTNTAEPFTSGTLMPGQTYSYTFNKAGSFDYICEIHPNMKGQIVVTQ